jgi:RNA polymerase sigma-70 factor (ECF subfamily)
MANEHGPTDVRLLVDEHYRSLYRYAYRLSGSATDAEDLTQEAFCTAHERIGQLRDSACARGWLFRILRNHYLARSRSRPPLVTVSMEELASHAEHVDEPDGDWDAEQLQHALDELPEAFRTPIILFYFEEYSYREISDLLGVPIGTVMSRLARAKAYLRSRLQSDLAAANAHAATRVS